MVEKENKKNLGRDKGSKSADKKPKRTKSKSSANSGDVTKKKRTTESPERKKSSKGTKEKAKTSSKKNASSNSKRTATTGKTAASAAVSLVATIAEKAGAVVSTKGRRSSAKNQAASTSKKATSKRRTSQKSAEKAPLKEMKIYPIGGLNEIGKNMTIVEYDDKILIIDCGMTFPEDGMYGIDVVIPDFSYIVENAHKVVGLVLTHGHEDHIGGIPYLLKQIKVDIYGTRLPLGLVENKLKEHQLSAKLHPIKAGETFKVGPFKIEAIRTTHSIADAICLAIETPSARMFHTGDFKIDFTPIDGEAFDFAKLAELGSKGVDIMLADSTNVLRKGFTPSERVVGQTLDNIFREAKNRIIIATFSSNVHRVQKIIELAHKYGRKVAVSGRSMENVVALAAELGYIKIPPNTYVELNKTSNIPDEELVIITTGSQGEPMSALARMATNEHKNVKLKKGDMVIFSSTPVPGNEKTVSNVVNRLFEKEVEVIYNDIADIHVSGHACQEELKIMQSLIRPKFFMPVHGEYRHLVQHAKLAESLGKDKDNIFILENGDCLAVTKNSANLIKGVINAEDVLVDGLGVGDVGNVVLKDRKMLSESGLLVVVAAIDKRNGYVLSGPDIVSRGFVYVKENEELINEAREIAASSIEKALEEGYKDWNGLKNNVREDLRRFIFKKTKRSPIILPIFMDI